MVVVDFLNIPPPNCPPPAVAAAAEMRGPPPHWNPPSPPLPTADQQHTCTLPTQPPPPPTTTATTVLEESQYEEPQMPTTGLQSDGILMGRPSVSARVPLAVNNNYILSNTQQMRNAARSRMMRPETSGAASPWNDESRQNLLLQNETGGYYVPPGSSHNGLTHSSNMDLPEKSSRGDTIKTGWLSHVSGSGKGSSTAMLNRNTSGARSAGTNLGKLTKHLPSWCTWKDIVLLLALLCCILAILFLYLHRGYPRSYSNCYPSYASSLNGFRIFNNDTELVVFPDNFQLGEHVEGDLPPKSLTFTKFSLQTNSRVIFNVSVGQKAQLAIYLKHILLPSPTDYEFSEIIQGNHLVKESGSITRRSLSDSNNLFRLAAFTYFLEAGRWNIGFLNDASEPEHIKLYASVDASSAVDQKDRLYDCKDGCSGKGECKNGRCHCFPGFIGQYCDRSYCPVLCSGNGKYWGGECVCYEGYKGKECDIPVQQCMTACVNGVCSQKGVCECDHGWTGDACDKKSCADPSCTGHGVCSDGKCFCEFGFKGTHCEEAFTLKSLCETSENVLDASSVTVASAPLGVNMACNSRGIIVNGTNVCRCIPGYHGDRCQLAICDFKCIHGSCGDGVCECESGWTGTTCEEKLCLPGCEEHGFCNNGTCKCQQGWNGENCHIVGCPQNCNNKGECKKLSNVWTCVCGPSHFGSDCSLPLESNCNDRIDNDGDGLTDCEDSECCRDKSCASQQSCTTVSQPSAVLLRYQTSANPTFFDKIKFLIEGNSVHLYADAKNYNESTASVIRGRVVSERGSPLTGVRISEAPHMGFTISRSEDNGGAFDLVVNGGRVITLTFLRRGLTKLERSFYVPWNEIVYIGDVKMHISSPQSVNAEAEPLKQKCRIFFASHRIFPTIFSSWQWNQYSGQLSHDIYSSQLLVESRKIFDSFRIPGTSSVYMVYDSARADNYSSTLIIKLLPENISNQLRLVHLKVEVAGTYQKRIFAAKPNLTYTFSWDQTNVYGQIVNGLANAEVSVGYVYAGCDSDRNIVWVHKSVKLEGKRAKRWTFGGWTLNIHHHYDYVNNVLERGDGSKIYLSESAKVLHTYVGRGHPRKENCLFCDNRKTFAHLLRPMALSFGSNGSLYIGDDNCIRKLLPGGSLVTVLELSASDVAHPYYIAVDPTTDTLFVSLPLRRQIWQVTEDTNGDLTSNYKVVVGDGTKCTDQKHRCGDGGKAELAQLTFPKGIAFDTEGNMYVADSRKIRVVQLEKYARNERIINTLIRNRSFGARKCVGDFADLNDVNLEWPTSLAVDRLSKDLLILDSDLIYRISVISGTAQLVAGKIPECDEIRDWNGDVLSLRSLNHATSIAVSRDSTIYIAETDGRRLNQVRALSLDGAITTVVGRLGNCDCKTHDCPCDDLKPTSATSAFLNYPTAIAFDPNDVLYIADEKNFKVKRLQHAKPMWNDNGNHYEIQNPNANEAYIFNRNGVHISTKTLFTDQWLYNFSYTVEISSGRLNRIVAGKGNDLSLIYEGETDRSREHIHLQTADRVRTTVFFDSFDKNLETVLLPTSETIEYAYLSGQLMKSKLFKSRAWFFSYDQFGRAKTLVDPMGNFLTLSEPRITSKKLVTTAMLNDQPFSTVLFTDKAFTEIGKSLGRKKATLLDNGILIENHGYKTQYDGVYMQKLDQHEKLIMKRKVTVPALGNGQRREINMRFEWREVVRERVGAGKRYWQVGRRPRVNGRNVIAIDYNSTCRLDTIQNAGDEDIFHLLYNTAGQLVSITPVGNSSLPKLQLNYDHLGRQREAIWGRIVATTIYGPYNQILQSGYSGDIINLTRKYEYRTNLQQLPSVVWMHSGEKYHWDYDDYGGITSLRSPSGNINRFAKYTTANRVILERAVSFKNLSYFSSYDDQGNLLEYITPDKEHFLSVEYDMHGRITKLAADGEVAEYFYSSGPMLEEISLSLLVRKYIRQGPLPVVIVEEFTPVEARNRVFPPLNVEYAYEYDDQIRLSKISIALNSTLFQSTTNFEYEFREGALAKINKLVFLQAGQISRIIGEEFMFETKRGAHGEEVERLIRVKDTKVASIKTIRDALGRTENVEWSVIREDPVVEKRTYDINGQLLHLKTVGLNHSWALFYDLDGRLKALNDKNLDMNRAGIPSQFGDTKYIADGNGWIVQRGDTSFEFDVFGRVKRAWRSSALEVEYGYDEKSRLIWRRVGAEYLQRFFYANPNMPYHISHFMSSSDDTVSTIVYDGRGLPIVLETADRRYAILTDNDRSVRYIFGANAEIIKAVSRDPLGRVLSDSNSSFFFPLGFMSAFEDPLIEIVILGREARPLDLYLGRYISTSISFVKPTVHVFRPEYEADPYRLQRSIIAEVPSSIQKFMELAGYSLENIVPSLRKVDFPKSSLLDIDAILACETGNPMVMSSSMCTINKHMLHFSHFLTPWVSGILPTSLPPSEVPDIVGFYTSNSTVGSKGIVLVREPGGRVMGLSIAKPVYRKALDRLDTLLRHSTIVDTNDFGCCVDPEVVAETHFATSLPESYDITNFNELNLLFKVSFQRNSLVLHSNRTQIVFHLRDDAKQVRDLLVDSFSQKMKSAIWASEVSALSEGRRTKHRWSQTEKKKLLSSGRLQNYDLNFRPGRSIPILANRGLWRFESL